MTVYILIQVDNHQYWDCYRTLEQALEGQKRYNVHFETEIIYKHI